MLTLITQASKVEETLTTLTLQLGYIIISAHQTKDVHNHHSFKNL